MLSVNLSADSLRDGVAGDVDRAGLPRTGSPCADLQVEVTETRSLTGERARAELAAIGDAR